MSIRLYDTATREVRDFAPLEEGKAGVYVCGLTVQSEPHVGHVRSAVNFDVLRRWLTHRGLEVSFIRNVTDIDDKILTKAAAQGRPWYNLAYDMKRELDAAYAALNVLPPTYEPAATGHVPEMLELIEHLIAKGHAYAAEDGSGDVYFDVRSWPSYGELTHQRIDDMEAAEDADPRGKRDPRDFALVSFGGAGGLHACRMAEALDMRRVIIPRNPGLLSAYGMLHAERVQYFAQTMVTRVDRITGSAEGRRALIQAAESLDERAREASAPAPRAARA